MRKYNTITPFRIACILTLTSLYFTANAQWYGNNCSNDKEPPVAVCEGHTVVSLGSDGTAKLYAESVDDGSHDNCEIKEFKIARMNEGWCDWHVADDTKFRSYAEFCCEDLGHPVWVILRVFDAKHNFNDCMAEVIVQDKLPPKIYCPPDKRIDCDYWYNPDELYDPHSKIFGSATAKDNCGLEGIHVDVKKHTTCHSGSIKRIFTAVDWGGASASCTQHIWVGSGSFGKHDIHWPKDYTADGCKVMDTKPEDLPYGFDRPRWSDTKCSMLAAAYEDKVFHFVEDVCTKIVRKWTVIDWCQYDPHGHWKRNKGIWEYTQIIKLKDDNKPEFWVCKDVTVEGFGANCDGRVVLDPEVYDICTPTDKLGYEYKIDKYANGSIDIIRKDKPVLDEHLPVGKHKVLWFVDDGCGNLATCSYHVTVKDGKAPTPVCYAQLSTVVMPQGGMVTIWARDFDASSFDNCTPASKLKFSFSKDTKKTSITFDCDNIGVNNLQVWVTDQSGNQAYCNTWLDIGDNAMSCESMNPVSGFVTTYTGNAVAAAQVELYKVMHDESMLSDRVKESDNDGFYQTGFGTTQYNRMMYVHKEGDVLDGIATSDLIMLQKHIVGTGVITDPYALFAADVDGSGRIDLNDLFMLRDAFLSNGRTLQGETLPWSFFPEECTWEGLVPVCSEMVEINRVEPPQDFVDFIGVKKGDINGNLRTELRWGRTIEDHPAVVGIRLVANSSGEQLQFIANSDFNADGMQFSVRSSQLRSISIDEIVEGALVGAEEALLLDTQRGLLNLAWANARTLEFKEGDILFSLKLYTGDLTTDIDVGTRGAYQNQVYSESNTDILRLEWLGTADDIAGVSSRQRLVYDLKVAPNPMREMSVITFVSPETHEATLDVYTTDMKLIHTRDLAVQTGENTVTLSSADMRGPGVYYYTMSSGDSVVSGKLIVID